MLKWIDIKERRPSNLQICLVDTDCGVVEATFYSEKGCFKTYYYYSEYDLIGYKWLPIEEVKEKEDRNFIRFNRG